MKILAIDIGAGTQDILYYNDEKNLENSIKLVLPSPPVRIVQKIKNKKGNIYFDGDIMGGGKIKNTIISKIQKGSEIAMEPQAAKTIKDDITVAKSLGIEIVEPKSYNNSKYENYSKISLKDIDIDELSSTIIRYDNNFRFDYIAIAVQDHGYDKNMGDRNFRFEKIKEKLKVPIKIEELAYYGNVPEYFTRMKSVERSLSNYKPIIMDSKFASICGASHDPELNKLNNYVILDVGNGHTMGASIENRKIQGVFEHHTTNLMKNSTKLEYFIKKLVDGTLTHEEVHDDNGHGAHIINPLPKLEKVIVTGPQRKIIKNTSLNYYNASPGGDVMMTGPVGLIKSTEYILKKIKKKN